MAASIITAVADPNEEPQSGIMSIDDILDLYNDTKALHPEWFIEGQGWGPQSNDKENTK